MEQKRVNRRSSVMSKLLGVLLSLILLPCCAFSQAATPTYDAVTIKPNKSGDNSTSSRSRDDSYQATNVALRQLLSRAYGVRESLISGLPPWAESARFDINAKIVDFDPAAMKKLTPEQQGVVMRGMMANLLESRFGVKTHFEEKQLSVYELVLTKDGPKFKASPPGPATDPETGKERTGMSTNSNNGKAELKATAVKLVDLAATLSRQLDRDVVDRTGLTGEYDFHLLWTAENARQPVPDDAPPLLFTAIQEQLGLRLQPGKGPVNTLVVDHVEQPTEN